IPDSYSASQTGQNMMDPQDLILILFPGLRSWVFGLWIACYDKYQRPKTKGLRPIHLLACTARSNGISSKYVIRLNARNRSLISSCVRRRTRLVPNSSTLNEAITDPKIIA